MEARFNTGSMSTGSDSCLTPTTLAEANAEQPLSPELGGQQLKNQAR
jgi:hypothetical protein